jgi:hypothetical protein
MSEVKVDTISERTAAGGVTIDGVLVKDGVATFQTAAGSPLVFEGATADAYETTFAITDPTADRTITFPDASVTLGAAGTNTPRFLAYNSTDTTAISDATYTTVVFDTELIDSDTAFATNTFTVPAGEGGVYYFHSSVECGDNTLGYLNSNAIRFRKTPDGGSAATIAYNNFTGQSLTYGAGWTATTRGWWDTISLDLVVTLAALDAIHVEVSVDVHAGGAGAKIFGDTASIPRTKFMGYKLL